MWRLGLDDDQAGHICSGDPEIDEEMFAFNNEHSPNSR
jgi:hypothetical protein